MDKDKKLAFRIYQKMMQKDRFSEWLGLKPEVLADGFCKMQFRVRPEMLNGFETIHGGVLFAACDSVFAFACNSHGLIAVALEASIHFTRPAKLSDILFVEARNIYLGKKTGLYEVSVTNEDDDLICLFKGTAYRTSKPALG